MKKLIEQKLLDEGWKKAIRKDEKEVIKLDVGEAIKGILTGRKTSNTFGYIYFIKVKDDPIEKIICGTSDLNDQMPGIPDGVKIIIERTKDVPTEYGKPKYQFNILWE